MSEIIMEELFRIGPVLHEGRGKAYHSSKKHGWYMGVRQEHSDIGLVFCKEFLVHFPSIANVPS